jgi:hypothetical protein
MERVIREVSDYCAELIARAEAKSGYPLLLMESDAIEFDSELNIASGSKQRHTVAYRPRYAQYRDHFVVNAAYKILRIWDTPKEQRYFCATESGRGLPTGDYQELREKIRSAIGTEGANALSKFLFAGLTRQLISFPTDIRVEKEISESLPVHREKQLSYLRRQVQDFLPTLNEDMLSVIPKRSYCASTAMNIAFAEEIAELSGATPAPAFRKHRSRYLAERLRSHAKAIQEPGFPGDRKLTDAWAKELGLEDWYSWITQEAL